MADVRISDLTAATAATAAMQIEVNDSGTSKSITVAQLKAYLASTAAFQALTDAATIAWDMSGYNAKVTLGGNRTLGTPTNPVEGLTYVLRAKQDGTGSRTLSYAACFNMGAAGAPTLTTTAGKADDLYFLCVDAAAPSFDYLGSVKGF